MNESGKKKGFSTAYGGKSEIHDTNRTVSDYSDKESSLTLSKHPRGRDRSKPDEFDCSSKTSEYTYDRSGGTQGTYSDPLSKTETVSRKPFHKMWKRNKDTNQFNLLLAALAFIIIVACALFFNRAFSEKSKDNPDAMLQSTTEPAVQAQPTPSTTKPHLTTTEPVVETQVLPNVTETVHQHDWQPATCSAPKTCASCGVVQGEPLSHIWLPAATGNFKTCVTCGQVKNISMQTKTLAAGFNHTVGLKADGTVVATGDNSNSQCNVGQWRDIVSVVVGWDLTVGLKSDGTVVTTGGAEWSDNELHDVTGWKNIVSIAASDSHIVGLKEDGTVVATGSNMDGQCDVGAWTNIVAIAAGTHYTVGLKSDGTVVATGKEQYGPWEIETWTDIVAIAAAGNCTVGLKSDGSIVWTTASGDFGTLVYDENGEHSGGEWTNILDVSAGYHHTVGLKKDGTVVVSGNDVYGQCKVGEWRNIVAVAAGFYHTVGLKADGSVIVTGQNKYGQCDVLDWKLSLGSNQLFSQW